MPAFKVKYIWAEALTAQNYAICGDSFVDGSDTSYKEPSLETSGEGSRLRVSVLGGCRGRKASQQPQCDISKKSNLREGIIGETKSLPWVGVLRFHIHEEDSLKIALTGIVLVKENYCITNANDVAKISHLKFTRESKAMFIIKDNETWSSGVLSYMIHPEYEFATYNTIALVELAEHYQEKQLLEKIIYKVEYIEHALCNEFYNRIGLKNNLYVPVHYFCAFAKNNKKNCVWENGMALVSNTTGPWTLIGFGVKGPGSAGPSRFIDISKYLPWIESSTDTILY
ncbi:uncharacterized protein LOC125072606 [Vanessa atalanta]|uniref:uncharacterized protein LOC125072606 n=1 Tax=Vanessa atalanta TaxID=42275 RepID=UPI001FCDE56B|nr:uncharacterized protein LOC125072606 [Vanessa atalanta]